MVTYAQRPNEIDGCWSTWSEKDVSNVIRTQMDTGAPKVRRRFTGTHRQAQVSITTTSNLVSYYNTWFRDLCQDGVMPTAIYEPDGTESVWRFMEPLTIEWGPPGSNYVVITVMIERLPGWQTL